MLAVGICEKMGWTYQEYMQQPRWFIKLLVSKMIIDSKKAKDEAENLKRKFKRKG